MKQNKSPQKSLFPPQGDGSDASSRPDYPSPMPSPSSEEGKYMPVQFLPGPSEADLAEYANAEKLDRNEPLLEKLGAVHRRIARLVAWGAKPSEIMDRVAISPSRLSFLKNQDHSFMALVAEYEGVVEAEHEHTKSQIAMLGEAARTELLERIAFRPETVTNETLLSIMNSALDRTGHGQKGTQEISFALPPDTVLAIRRGQEEKEAQTVTIIEQGEEENAEHGKGSDNSPPLLDGGQNPPNGEESDSGAEVGGIERSASSEEEEEENVSGGEEGTAIREDGPESLQGSSEWKERMGASSQSDYSLHRREWPRMGGTGRDSYRAIGDCAYGNEMEMEGGRFYATAKALRPASGDDLAGTGDMLSASGEEPDKKDGNVNTDAGNGKSASKHKPDMASHQSMRGKSKGENK